jgi:hypothetical protein
MANPATDRGADERLAALERDADRKWTFASHMHCQVAELPDVDGDDTDVDIRIDPQRIKGRPFGVECVEVRNLDNPEAPGSYGGSVQWHYRAPIGSGAGYVRITNFPGLMSGGRYLVRFLIIGS